MYFVFVFASCHAVIFVAPPSTKLAHRSKCFSSFFFPSLSLYHTPIDARRDAILISCKGLPIGVAAAPQRHCHSIMVDARFCARFWASEKIHGILQFGITTFFSPQSRGSIIITTRLACHHSVSEHTCLMCCSCDDGGELAVSPQQPWCYVRARRQLI